MIFTLDINSENKHWVLLNFIIRSNFRGNYVRPAFTVSVRDGSQGDWSEAFIRTTEEHNTNWQDVIFCVNDYLDNFDELQIKITTRGGATATNSISSLVDNILVLTTDPKVNIENIESPSTVIFPNPTTDEATIIMDLETVGDIRISLDNLLGEELFEIHSGFSDAGTFTKTFSLEALPVGVYYLRIVHNGNVTVEKVIRR
jgi:hypothetical protein